MKTLAKEGCSARAARIAQRYDRTRRQASRQDSRVGLYAAFGFVARPGGGLSPDVALWAPEIVKRYIQCGGKTFLHAEGAAPVPGILLNGFNSGDLQRPGDSQQPTVAFVLFIQLLFRLDRTLRWGH